MDKPVNVLAERVFNNCPSPEQQAGATLYSESQWQQERALPELSSTRKIDWVVDFGIHSVIRYTMGSKPTLGYGVKRNGEVKIDGSTAVLTVQELMPAPGSIGATALTTPCVYVQIEAAGLSGVRVVNTDGTVLAESR